MFENLEGFAERQFRIQEYIKDLQNNNLQWYEDLSNKRQQLGLNDFTSDEIQFIENHTKGV